MIFKKLSNNLTQQRHDNRKADLLRNLMRREAKIGGELFGQIAPGGRREFVCLDSRTWLWHEEWIDENGQRKIRTTRYDVRPSKILKAQDGRNYQEVSPQEAKNLYEAAKKYKERVHQELYPFVQF